MNWYPLEYKNSYKQNITPQNTNRPLSQYRHLHKLQQKHKSLHSNTQTQRNKHTHSLKAVNTLFKAATTHLELQTNKNHPVQNLDSERYHTNFATLEEEFSYSFKFSTTQKSTKVLYSKSYYFVYY